MKDKQLIIVGASARAAACSAQRAGYSVYWLDQFGDTDVQAIYPGQRIPANDYPTALPKLMRSCRQAPFIYTGAMEKHLAVLKELEGIRTLFGNSSEVCRRLQQHKYIADLLAHHSLPVAKVIDNPVAECHPGKWLQKPVCGAGGMGIEIYKTGKDNWQINSGRYCQQFIEGQSRSAVFIGDGKQCQLFGVSQQLVGLPELYAAAYSYCGSVGSLNISARERTAWLAIAEVLVTEFSLKGVFGIDAIVRDEDVYLLEINPRYTASVEVHELSRGINSIELHYRACLGDGLPSVSEQVFSTVSKAYLFAPKDVRAPASNRMRQHLRLQDNIQLADTPATGEMIAAGQPIMTILCRENEAEKSYATLLDTAAKIYDFAYDEDMIKPS